LTSEANAKQKPIEGIKRKRSLILVPIAIKRLHDAEGDQVKQDGKRYHIPSAFKKIAKSIDYMEDIN
jgi:hypothetical protein